MPPRDLADKIIQAALRAVDPAQAVQNYFFEQPKVLDRLKATEGRLIVIGAGKASAPMAAAISELFEGQIAAGLVIVKYGHTVAEELPLDLIEAGHPVPDQAGRDAAADLAELLRDTSEADTVLCLMSGGGSALLTLPAEGVSLDDLQATTETLLNAGATITQLNTVRKHLSAVKGGGLAKLVHPARLHSLILSDVVGDPLPVIASGPTVPDPSTFAQAWAVIQQFDLQDELPQAVIKRLQAGIEGEIAETPKPDDPIFERVENVIIGSNRIAAEAATEAAQLAGLEAHLLSTFIEGEAREVGRVVAGLAKGLAQEEGDTRRPACYILGGETTVTLKGEGKGGRNQEMALAAAIALDGWQEVLVVCFGTDGNDGPTDAAGAFADGETIARARARDLNAWEYLQRNDSYHFFEALDDLIITGPTNTNVNDLTLVFAF